MEKKKKTKEPVEIIKEVPKKINNASILDAYTGSIDAAASGFAERKARSMEMKILNAPGFDFGVRYLAYELVANNLISCEDLFKFLQDRCWNKFDGSVKAWWNNN